MDNESEEGTILVACAVLSTWFDEGRGDKMPGYCHMFGRPYMAMLLGLPCHTKIMYKEGRVTQAIGFGFSELFRRQYVEGGHTLARNIIGPNGWAMLQYYIARANADAR